MESPEIKSPPSQQSDSMTLDESNQSSNSEYTMSGDDVQDRQIQLYDKPLPKDGLHPHVQTLSITDLEACLVLENAAFPESERCSREKVQDYSIFYTSLCTCWWEMLHVKASGSDIWRFDRALNV